MPDAPSTTPECAFCDWRGDLIREPGVKNVREKAQLAVLTHHISAHGFPSQPGDQRTEWLTYFPDDEAVVTLRRTFAGIALVDDGVVRLLEDDRPDALRDLNPIVRAVLTARLRAWADQVGDVIELRIGSGERVL